MPPAIEIGLFASTLHTSICDSAGTAVERPVRLTVAAAFTSNVPVWMYSRTFVPLTLPAGELEAFAEDEDAGAEDGVGRHRDGVRVDDDRRGQIRWRRRPGWFRSPGT